MFHEVHFVEKWGRGISLILDKEPDADFEVVAGIFVTTFKRKHYVPSPAKKTVEETRVKTRVKIIDLIKNNPEISTGELAKELGITVKGIEWNIKKLKQAGILERIGPAKGGHWEVKE